MISRPRGPALLLIAGIALCWGASYLPGRNGSPVSPGTVAVLRCAAAVALVAMATVLVASAVRAVSSRPVVRIHHRDDDEPPLPYHKPEPESGEDAWTPLPAGRQASALPLPGRAPATPPKRTLAPEPGYREVPR
jgi:hypothetical protein